MVSILKKSLVATAVVCFAPPALAASTKPTGKKVSKPAAAATATPAPVQNPVWDFAVKSEDSVFAVITQKAGLAAKLAHNHLIAARNFETTLSADSGNLNKGTFTFKTKASDLEVDREDLQKKWFPTIQALGWLNEPFSALKDSDRETIREHMLADNQLNQKKCPEITAKVDGITAQASKQGERTFSHKATVAVTICGQTVSRELPANITLQGQELKVEAAGSFKFTEFGITPYKALMGALGNQDGFYLLVSFRAAKK